MIFRRIIYVIRRNLDFPQKIEFFSLRIFQGA